MAALLEPPPPFSNLHLSSSSSSISFHTQKPNFLRLQNNQSKPILLYLHSPPPLLLKPLYCSALSSGAIDPPQPKPPPIEDIPNPNPSGGERRDSISIPSSSSGSTTESRKKDRRKTVKLAWEKLVRWSRSWRNKNKTDVLQRTKKVVVLGGGSFGTAMAAHVANNKAEMEVTMLLRDPVVCLSINESHYNCKYFPEHKLPDNVIATTDAKTALDDADFCLHAVPVQFSSSFLEDISEHVNSSLPIISLSKGLELNTLRMMSQIIPQALGNPRQPFVALSGPSFALELMKKLPTAMVVASKDRKLASSVQQLLSSQHLRISTSSDVTGVEIAGALKNVLAIAAGIVEGMDLGNNSMAALVAQGCSEIRWLATKKQNTRSTSWEGGDS
ncbi:glycerol-3-phosphate dehydrogenase [NAD(+)] 2, chloroplastic isoform X2 [Papaver somniferum]|uniref:glycerol-3-phosphate dehydrogenase [NAD(+)] 2, chloroplastic isoform X2 n=1 Tax=Papaver somniferum TaxID=3469 RepID=UPI000E7049FF|nr:glycerol-3-phosphate dehydrogenase [NAD(+)] 2, chloroplastic isoform X2 [Papaver somniferum]